MNLTDCTPHRRVQWQRGRTWHAAHIMSTTATRVRVLVMLRGTPVYRYVHPGRLAALPIDNRKPKKK